MKQANKENTSNLDPYEQIIRLEKLDPYESCINSNIKQKNNLFDYFVFSIY